MPPRWAGSALTYSKVRKQAPAWKGKAVKNGEIVDLASSDYKGKWLVLFFYPLDFTFVCPTEIVEFNNKYAEFKKLGAEVVGVSVDSPHTHLAWTRTDRKDGGLGAIDFPLLSDITKRISSSYGVLVEDEADEHFGVTMRGTYIIDPEGVVRSFSINDEPVGRNIDEVMRLLQAAQHAAANKGQGCPANWKKGDKTIKANRKDSLEFFKQWM
ncbi:hypothetical protein GUITHDRAFT_77318 [Guillardia theta CCMP2712]|uniref:Thioredoxin domain-containing protein n=1 Tax=Guillardia theta (strain CCMP2712) TaxID=905079 RepID=L1IR62_GUITC|nr:hypothetical protein GUITHDRAFT_77318 [Guillardia theta CCMP2712]EKX38290.1 hypothetical protein GUITHDRAFT_77318 [Guillardia theta CCMP2712]|eukprot:XP_005825270.1 hypothetical protein GUITHDRAFT_77318 [Guillardia theta CCMP2712]